MEKKMETTIMGLYRDWNKDQLLHSLLTKSKSNAKVRRVAGPG